MREDHFGLDQLKLRVWLYCNHVIILGILFLGITTVQAQTTEFFDPSIARLQDPQGKAQRDRLSAVFHELFRQFPVEPDVIEERVYMLARLKAQYPEYWESLRSPTLEPPRRGQFEISKSLPKRRFVIQEIEPFLLLFHPELRDEIDSPMLRDARVFLYRFYDTDLSDIEASETNPNEAEKKFRPWVGIEIQAPTRNPKFLKQVKIHLKSPWSNENRRLHLHDEWTFLDFLVQNRWAPVIEDAGRKAIVIPEHFSLAHQPQNNRRRNGFFFHPVYLAAIEASRTVGRWVWVDPYLHPTHRWTDLLPSSNHDPEKEVSLEIYSTLIGKLDFEELKSAPSEFTSRLLSLIELEYENHALEIDEMKGYKIQAIPYFLIITSIYSKNQDYRRRARKLVLDFFQDRLTSSSASLVAQHAVFLHYKTQNTSEKRYIESLFPEFEIRSFPDEAELYAFLRELVFSVHPEPEEDALTPSRRLNITHYNIETALSHMDFIGEWIVDRLSAFQSLLTLFFFRSLDRDADWYEERVADYRRRSPMQVRLAQMLDFSWRETFRDALEVDPFEEDPMDEYRIITRVPEDTDPIARALLLLPGIEDYFTLDEEDREEIQHDSLRNRTHTWVRELLERTGVTDSEAIEALLTSAYENEEFRQFIEIESPQLHDLIQREERMIKDSFDEEDDPGSCRGTAFDR